jgi:hypothetical protein
MKSGTYVSPSSAKSAPRNAAPKTANVPQSKLIKHDKHNYLKCCPFFPALIEWTQEEKRLSAALPTF